MMFTKTVAASCERKYAGLSVDRVALDGSFSGYASLFGEIDLGKDTVERGAFARSLRRRGASGIRMLYQHDPAQPIGTWVTIAEDARGLFVRGRLSQGSARGREVLELMRDGALDGLSIGYRTLRARREAGSGIRRILEADLWEISIVTFPMLPGARVGQVKADGRKPPAPRDLERWLRRDAGLSRRDARLVMAKGYAALRDRREADGETSPRLTETIRHAAALFTEQG